MSKNTYLIIIAIAALAIVGGIIYFTQINTNGNLNKQILGNQPESGEAVEESGSIPLAPGENPGIIHREPGPEANLKNPAPAINTQPAEEIIKYADSGYSPSTLNIKAGTTVIFKNESSRQMWPASAQHPTHTVYPGSDIKKCGTAEEGKIFDACKGIEPGGSWSFKFNEKGGWGYHDHLNPNAKGRIVVE